MFRSILKENVSELKSVSSSVKKVSKFQRTLDKDVKGVLKQKVGEVKRTLPSGRTKLDECMKRIGDVDLCTIIISKYQKIYSEICQASPAVCDDFQSTVTAYPVDQPIPVADVRKKPETFRL